MLPSSQCPSSHVDVYGSFTRGDSAGYIMSSEKWAPGWESVVLRVSCPPDSDRSFWSFTIPPKERRPIDLVRLDLAKCPYHKTSPHGQKCHPALTSHHLSSAFVCPPRGPSLRQDPDQGFLRAKGLATMEHVCFISMATDAVFHLRC